MRRLEEAELLLLVDEAAQTDALRDAACHDTGADGAEPRARARDDQADAGERGDRIHHQLGALVRLDTPEHEHGGLERARAGTGAVAAVVDAVRDDAHVRRPEPAPHQLRARALGDCDHRQPAIEPGHEPLGRDQRRRHRRRRLAERRPPEEVVREDDERLAHPETREERKLVQVLDHHVEGRLGAQATVQARDARVVADAGVPAPQHAEPVDVLLGRGAREARGDERHLVAARREPAEDLAQVHLRAARLRVARVALVQHEEAAAHRRPSRCASRSHQQIQSASRPMRFDIFDSPRTRSMKMIGTSRMRCARVQAR